MATTAQIEKAFSLKELTSRYGVGSKDITFYLKGKMHWLQKPHSRRVVGTTVFNLRYSRMFDTPFVDLQHTNEPVKLGGIVWENGKIIAPASDPTLQLYLLLSPGCNIQGGKTYEVYDRKLKIDEEKVKYETKKTAMDEVYRATDIKLFEAARLLFPSSKYSEGNERDEALIDFHKQIDKNAQSVIDTFKDEDLELKSDIIILQKAGIILLKNGTYVWKDGNVIFDAPPTKDKLSAFVRFLNSSDGSLAYEKVINEVKDIQ